MRAVRAERGARYEILMPAKHHKLVAAGGVPQPRGGVMRCRHHACHHPG